VRFLIAGASGFLGTAWRDHLAREGHEVVRLVRGEALSGNESHWDPYAGQVDRAQVEAADVVANLAGAPLAHWPWTRSYQRTFRASRLETTRTLARAVAESERKPAFVAQNGIAGYGDRGDEVLTEESSTDADTFMGQVTRDWLAETRPAEDAGARVVVMRTAVVLESLGPLFWAFRLGLGGPIGGGRQYFSTISLADWVRAATYLATTDTARGVYNLSAPEQGTNAELGRTIGRTLHRPSVVPVPAFVPRTFVSPIASELLSSTRVRPARLLEVGFTFEHPTLESRVRAALG
jgi:uncharacterized protein (TIGR01777 family)